MVQQRQQQQRQHQYQHNRHDTEDGDAAAWWDPHHHPLMNDKQKAVLLDWIEQGMDFFGCDENVPKNVFGHHHHQHGDHHHHHGFDPLRISQHPNRATDLHNQDYARQHDNLLESLMAEQSKKANEGTMADFDSSASSFSFSSLNSQLMNTSMNSNSVVSSSYTPPPGEEAADEAPFDDNNNNNNNNSFGSQIISHKRRRRVMPVLSSSSTNNNNSKVMRRQQSSNSSVSSKSTTTTTTARFAEEGPKKRSSRSSRPGSDSVRVSLTALSEVELPPAATYIHPQCRLQKDKGKGEAAGSNICAKGRDHCLLKLEQKMALLTRVAFGEENKNKGTADMKRRPARVAEVFPNFIETRSVIELRMGFMSMQYGILLRWDTSRTGKVTLVVLRKMCHESFYTKCKPTPPPPLSSSSTTAPTTSTRQPLATKRMMPALAAEPPSCAVRNVIDGNHAILQRPGGTEVALLEAPYRVDRPHVFPHSLLTVSVQDGSGLRRKSNWTVQLSYNGTTENILLTWDSVQASFTPKLGDKLKHEIPIDDSLDLPALQIRLFEHRKRKPRKCVGQMHVPLLGLEAQPSNPDATPSFMKVVCSHDPDACVTLSVLLQSDYALWLRKELDARRREEVNGFVWKSSFRVVPDAALHQHQHNRQPLPHHHNHGDDEVIEDDEEEEDDDSLWEWFCSAC